MKAAVFYAARDIRIESIPVPSPSPTQVLIQVSWAGICGSDLHEYTHGPLTLPRQGRPHPITNSTIPAPMGHEFCGIVAPDQPAASQALTSANGKPLLPGTKVMVDPRLYCAQPDCINCANGNTNACPKWGFHGLSGCCGGFAEYAAVEARMCYVLPAEVDLATAALIEPLAVCWHALRLAGVEDYADKTVLIVGGGPVGIALVATLRIWGAKRILVSEPTEMRREQCRALVEVVVDPTATGVGDECRKLSPDGQGADVAFDAAGVQAGLDGAMDALRYGGMYVNIALWASSMVVPFLPFITKDAVLKCSLAYNDRDFAETVEAFVQGKFKGVEKMVTSRIAVDEVVDRGFEELVANRNKHVKILVAPHKH